MGLSWTDKRKARKRKSFCAAHIGSIETCSCRMRDFCSSVRWPCHSGVSQAVEGTHSAPSLTSSHHSACSPCKMKNHCVKQAAGSSEEEDEGRPGRFVRSRSTSGTSRVTQLRAATGGRLERKFCSHTNTTNTFTLSTRHPLLNSSAESLMGHKNMSVIQLLTFLYFSLARLYFPI